MKDKKRNFGILLGLILILSVTNKSTATIIELTLDCAGTYSTGPGWSVDFDLGVEFTNIAHVYIDWEGEITAAKAVYYSNPNDPFPIDVGITANFGSNPYLRIADVWAGMNEYPNPEQFDLLSEVQLVGNSTWSDLLDGKGNMKIYYSSPGMMFGYIIEKGSVTLNEAILKIDGTLVPEPATIILLAMGSVGIFIRKKRL